MIPKAGSVFEPPGWGALAFCRVTGKAGNPGTEFCSSVLVTAVSVVAVFDVEEPPKPGKGGGGGGKLKSTNKSIINHFSKQVKQGFKILCLICLFIKHNKIVLRGINVGINREQHSAIISHINLLLSYCHYIYYLMIEKHKFVIIFKTSLKLCILKMTLLGPSRQNSFKD